MIIGDLPIYVAEDSVEAWTERHMFILDDENKISLVAGVPPDDFSDEGQLWGNPVYNWGYHMKNSFEWWIKRLKWNFSLFDLVRMDHFRGFDEFWAVKAGSKNAIDGKWLPANGKKLFDYALKEIGNLNIIAEDLGVITNTVIELKESYNFPGMKILQFAFDGNPQNPYLPQNYEENSVAYTGTHDNDTLLGWLKKLNPEAEDYMRESLKIKETENLEIEEAKEKPEARAESKAESEDDCPIVYKLIEKLLQSKSKLTIIPLQDYLCLDSNARINTPSTLGGNWMWRVKKDQLKTELVQKIKQMTINSNRI
ncbi:4-alpha-glucanotransferase [bioreactor metagenome]|uniref:4-alpha-glucanotransferase n=1 Tax=bioreactor metagenome TaxID=1076179 RepID=A0A645DX99_9ZZZZ